MMHLADTLKMSVLRDTEREQGPHKYIYFCTYEMPTNCQFQFIKDPVRGVGKKRQQPQQQQVEIEIEIQLRIWTTLRYGCEKASRKVSRVMREYYKKDGCVPLN